MSLVSDCPHNLTTYSNTTISDEASVAWSNSGDPINETLCFLLCLANPMCTAAFTNTDDCTHFFGAQYQLKPKAGSTSLTVSRLCERKYVRLMKNGS